MKKMGKVRNRLISILLGLSLASFLLSFNISASINKVDAAVGNYDTDASTYYNSISATSGQALAAELHDLITSTHRTYTTYDDNGKNGYQKQTDQYYENGSKVNGYIYEFYSGVKWPNAWAPNSGDTAGGYNREHCWCQSNSKNLDGKQMWGETGGGADMHHLRPVEVRLNSTRNNNLYGEISSGRESHKVYAKLGSNATYAHGGYCNNGVFEPLDSKKGDVARIILYVYLHYNSYDVSSIFGSYGTTNGNGSPSYFSSSLLPLTRTINATTESKAIEMLLSWNQSDPVDDLERHRNEQVATYQGNRNPFIDNSNYANMIWGSSPDVPSVNSVSVSPSNLTLDLSGTKTANLTATVNVSHGAPTTVTWSSSNNNVATVSNSGVVTAINKGSCLITATSTYNTSKSGSSTIKVIDSSSGEDIEGTNSWDLSKASYDPNPTTESVKWSSDSLNIENTRNGSGNTAVNNYLGGDANKRTSSRFYKNNKLIFSPGKNYTISSVVFTATSNDYATALANSTWTNATASSNNLTVTVTPINSGEFYAIISGTSGFTNITVNYVYHSGGVSSPLDHISLNTSNVQTEFNVGDTFDYSGLIVTAHYENGTEDTVDPTNVSSPDMSTVGEKIITVTYTENNISKSSTYKINVISQEITGISASVDKDFHPGEVIHTSDITVIDNFGNLVSEFSFSEDGYQFTYLDAPSGGDSKTKTFLNSVIYLTFTTDLSVNVNRINYSNVEDDIDTMNNTWIGVSGNSYSDWSGKSLDAGVVYAGNTAGGHDSIQMRSDKSSSGIVATSNPSGHRFTKVVLSWNTNTTNGRTVSIYGSSTPYSSATNLYNNEEKGTLIGSISYGTSTSLNITEDYLYIGIRSSSGALYLDEIKVTYESADNAKNVSNYIMYEDNNDQCLTKFDIAKTYFENLSNNEKEIFMSSNDYVILNARERFLSWARHKGFEIRKVDGEYVLTTNQNSFISVIKDEKNTPIFLIVLLSTISISTIGVYFYLKRKKENY